MDQEEQEDELLALQSIFASEEFIRKESKCAGEIRVSVELPEDFTVVLKHGGETLRQYDISFLPPLLLNFELPEDYPSSSPPAFTLTCSWLSHTQLGLLSAQLADLYEATRGAVVLFSWVQFLREDALKLLDIHSLLELPSDKPSYLPDKKSKEDNEPSLAAANNTPKPTDVSYLSGHGSSVSSGGNLLNHSTSAQSRDSQGASGLNSNEADQKDLCSSGTKAHHPEADATVLQISDFKSDSRKDLSSAADKSEGLPSSESFESRQEGVFNKSEVSQPLSEKEPVRPTEISSNNESTSAFLSLTPSQKLMSQILIYNAAQKQKVFATTVFDCGVCYTGWLGSECVQLHECSHVFCRACLGEFCKVQINEGNIRGVTCPHDGCTATPTPAQVRSLVGEELFSRYDRLLLQSTLDCMSDVTYCPRTSCSSAVILEESSNAAMCSVCSFAFCVKCKKTYHGTKECYVKTKQKVKEDIQLDMPRSLEGKQALLDDYIASSTKRRGLLESRYGRRLLLSMETNLCEEWKSTNTRPCPHCFCPIEKNGGCFMMWCTQCQQQFMWL
nr:E3 ubiquitin-protein ligase RNF14 isoform X1 [Nothobranchius furzeri]